MKTNKTNNEMILKSKLIVALFLYVFVAGATDLRKEAEASLKKRSSIFSYYKCTWRLRVLCYA